MSSLACRVAHSLRRGQVAHAAAALTQVPASPGRSSGRSPSPRSVACDLVASVLGGVPARALPPCANIKEARCRRPSLCACACARALARAARGSSVLRKVLRVLTRSVASVFHGVPIVFHIVSRMCSTVCYGRTKFAHKLRHKEHALNVTQWGARAFSRYHVMSNSVGSQGITFNMPPHPDVFKQSLTCRCPVQEVLVCVRMSMCVYVCQGTVDISYWPSCVALQGRSSKAGACDA